MIFARKQIKWDYQSNDKKVVVLMVSDCGTYCKDNFFLFQRVLFALSVTLIDIAAVSTIKLYFIYFLLTTYIDPEEVRLSFSLILWSLPTCHATRMKRNIWTELVSICFLFWIELTQRRAATAAAAPHGDKYNKNGQQLMQCDRKGDCDENEADQPASLNLNQGDHQHQHVRSDFIQK